MIGKYRIFLDGKQVSESENLITDYGRIAILRYLAGITSLYAGAISVGICDDAPTVSDSSLGYEVASEIIDVSSVDYENSEILFKATINTKTRIVIKEVGMFPEKVLSRSGILYYFDSGEEWANVDARNLVDIRLSDSGIDKTASAGSPETLTLNDQVNFGEALLTDNFCLAFLTYDDNCDYIQMRFTDIYGDTMTMTTDDTDQGPIVHSEADGDPEYHIYEFEKSMFSGQDKSWSQITKIEIIIQPDGGQDTRIVLDAFRISDSNVPAGSEIVSKTRLGEEVIKDPDSTLDIEYSLSVPI